jgi:two-component sensor histidine kinase
MYTNEIHLKYNQNVFSFDFIGIHYSSPEDIRILFMMENLDNTWRKASHEKKAFYYNVPPGRYIFHVKAANRDGVWAEKIIAVIINPPWYKTWWAYVIYALSFVFIIWFFTWYRLRKLKAENLLLEEKVAKRTIELQKEKEKVETTLAELKVTQEQLIEVEKKAAIEKSKQAVLNERFRISRELHDEVGATLSSISIFSQAAIQKNDSGDISDSKNILEKIGETSREVMGELNDTVWLINPINDNLNKIIQRISNYALPLCITKDIRLEIKNELAENPALDIERRKAVYLIMKEAVNNTLKYAFAENLVIQFEKKWEVLHISIWDDGKGFDKNNSFTGNGLNNMKQRATDIKGKIEINSASQKGTQIILQVPLTNIGD